MKSLSYAPLDSCFDRHGRDKRTDLELDAEELVHSFNFFSKFSIYI